MSLLLSEKISTSLSTSAGSRVCRLMVDLSLGPLDAACRVMAVEVEPLSRGQAQGCSRGEVQIDAGPLADGDRHVVGHGHHVQRDVAAPVADVAVDERLGEGFGKDVLPQRVEAEVVAALAGGDLDAADEDVLVVVERVVGEELALVSGGDVERPQVELDPPGRGRQRRERQRLPALLVLEQCRVGDHPLPRGAGNDPAADELDLAVGQRLSPGRHQGAVERMVCVEVGLVGGVDLLPEEAPVETGETLVADQKEVVGGRGLVAGDPVEELLPGDVRRQHEAGLAGERGARGVAACAVGREDSVADDLPGRDLPRRGGRLPAATGQGQAEGEGPADYASPGAAETRPGHGSHPSHPL